MELIIESLPLSIAAFIIGTIFLYFGADGLVGGSSSIAIKAGLSPLVVGLTIVAFGTSSPELVVCISAGFKGSSSIALGNVIGSNICNIALIIGTAAVIRPMKIELRVIKVDMFIMIIVSALMILFISDGKISRIEGIALFIGIITYTVVTVIMARRQSKKEKNTNTDSDEGRSIWLDLLITSGGMLLLVGGANLFVDGAVGIAGFVGVSDAVIGLTVVAFGTSLPELATSIIASLKDKGDISIGNAIGSNIYNILLILGFTSILLPISSGEIGTTDFIVMMAVTILIYPLARLGLSLTRMNGVFLLLIYFGYIAYLYSQG